MEELPGHELTLHAQQAMQEREILVEWLSLALSSPQLKQRDKDDPELLHFLRCIPEYGDRVLRVVVNVQTSPRLIVTMYFDRGMKGKL